METKKIEGGKTKSPKDSKLKKGAAAGIAGVGLAAGTLAYASGESEDVAQIEVQPVEQPEEVADVEVVAEEMVSEGGKTPEEETLLAVNEEHVPIGEVSESEPIVMESEDPEEPDFPSGSGSTPVDYDPEHIVNVIDPIDEIDPYDPEYIVNVIDPIDEIDPDDIDEVDIINIDAIGTVSTVSGEEFLAAAIHDGDGNSFYMVDVDGDDVFDVIATISGDVVAPVVGDIDLSDAEQMMTSEDPFYLAANEYDNNLDTGSEIQNDIIGL